jgi:hypothetical protein
MAETPATPPARPPEVLTPKNDAEGMQTAVGEMHKLAASMASSAAVMLEQVQAACSAVRTVTGKVEQLGARVEEISRKTDANTDELQRQQLAPTRARAITLPEITGSSPPPSPVSQAVTSPAPQVYVSVSPLEAAVGSASVHAIEHAVPAARRENRLLTFAIAVLLVVQEILHFLRH